MTKHGQNCAEIARTMISEDTIDNALPADLTSWESLNDYCDANEYVNDCVARHGIRAAAETVEAIERWLKSGRPLDIPQPDCGDSVEALRASLRDVIGMFGGEPPTDLGAEETFQLMDRAQIWLGQALQLLGMDNPYADEQEGDSPPLCQCTCHEVGSHHDATVGPLCSDCHRLSVGYIDSADKHEGPHSR